MSKEIVADMGFYVLGEASDVLVSIGLGSCVGVVIYDSDKKIAGLAHIMLPKNTNTSKDTTHINLNKFADVAIVRMIDDIKKKGCLVKNLKAKISGGAQMFKLSSDVIEIGKKNVEAVTNILKEQSIQIVSKDVLGSLGRTIRFNVDTKELTVKTKDGIKTI